jgi:hypothetical protein
MAEDLDSGEQTATSSGFASGTSGGPVGDGNYEVQQGDCLESIAYEHGFFWETLWHLAENADLKRERKDPNVLLSGDKVFIPAKREKIARGSTQERHRFRRKGVPSRLCLIVTDEDDEPRRYTPYRITIDGQSRRGATNREGLVDEPIPPNAKAAELVVGEGEDAEEYELELGALDPPDQLTGIQGRLTNLGYDAGPADGHLGPRTRMALEQFQRVHQLEPTGEPDRRTQQKLEEMDRV